MKYKMWRILVLLNFFNLAKSNCDINNFFGDINDNVLKFNAIAASIEWASSVNQPSIELNARANAYLKRRITWQQQTCNKLADLHKNRMLNETQIRQSYILCRGPAYNIEDARNVNKLNEKIQTLYQNAVVCISKDNKFSPKSETQYLMSKHLVTINKNYLESDICLNENDLEQMMTAVENEIVLKWIWSEWRKVTGPLIKDSYNILVDIENEAARKNGYTDIGEFWRDELEIPNLTYFCRNLYKSVKPLYILLHGVVRYFLRKKFGDVVPARGTIPSHLLGNLWNQNWESLSDIIIPNSINLDATIMLKNWTVAHMVKTTEDFYRSLGLPPMTDTFWNKSVFSSKDKHKIYCHGTAADMFKEHDYRLMYCADVSLQDFNVLHHEMGHIQYYMAYAHQPALFRQANSIFHESIGEAIMIGVLTPQHLNRIGLINDSTLFSQAIEKLELSRKVTLFDSETREFTTNTIQKQEKYVTITTDIILLLKRALNKLPQIPFSLLIDEYRWKYFEGGIDKKMLNREFWMMTLELQGLSPPEERDERFFDIGSIYHVADNTPFIRYFLSNFFQHQLFEHLCKVAVFDSQRAKEDLPKTMPINRCDIYGAKAAGKVLNNFMSRGNSRHWREILKATLDEDEITSDALLRYYRPLQDFLIKLVEAHNIPVGW